ncbi:2-oxo-hepta-3-ene-1,7-dioic acid hydratase [Mesorhizobium sp. ISC25]|uniref:2-oxo-hept-4-ene-1,7-dioate hydratase n=1 Tax=Mesorhizobium sp. ISC25 TaxID=3077335 RepID=UPI0035D9EBD4
MSATLTQAQIAGLAQRLFDAERSGIQTGVLSLEYPDAGMDDAYAVQAELVRLKLATGRVARGWKIGLTSKAMQYALNIEIPDSGVLLDDMFFPDSATIPEGRFIQPRVEAEIAFVMKSALAGPDVSIFDVINATDFIMPSLEILDTRVQRVDPVTKKTRTIFDTISDNAANAGIVMGGRPIRPDAADMRWIGAIVSRNGQVEETGLGAGVLNHPAAGVAWLARRLASYGGRIEPGEVVLSGSFIRPVEARHGDTIVADFGPFGSVSVYFE